ncbi:MAG TPA: gamma-glutamyl-gamma-aminobutyrate hydrolase family protein, partial [Bryobacteraceae bacterium]|nr:gamma-glutamyl-gamma-aminobutyrate hydrolase family protein [Bryobacteraceae bacterium]
MEPVFTSPGAAVPENFHGLLLMGGTDVNPALYGETPHGEASAPDDARDRLECDLIQQALDRDIPLLAICRGIQILNVQQGGTLIQHLRTSDRHRVRNGEPGLPAHPVEVAADSRLAAIGGEPLTWNVNSRHHQAIGRVGEALHVSA